MSLSGTPREHLVEAHTEALAVIRAAREALVGTEPNGRDYIGQEDAFKTARARHVGRLAALETVEAELAGILEGIVDGVLP